MSGGGMRDNLTTPRRGPTRYNHRARSIHHTVDREASEVQWIPVGCLARQFRSGDSMISKKKPPRSRHARRGLFAGSIRAVLFLAGA
jgi:hypothetical protein